MSDQGDPNPPKRTRATAFVIIAVLVVVIVAFIGIGFYTAFGPTTAATTSAAASPATSAPLTVAPTTTVASPSASATKKASTKATPAPTTTATISAPATIKKSLTAAVTKQVAVEGKAQGPGEISGPAVRFTVTIKNTTGKAFDLSTTVVNAFYGTALTPASQIELPGGKAFPQSVADGATATGVFLFTMPTTERSHVEVTVDTAVGNPVVAFKGSAPKS